MHAPLRLRFIAKLPPPQGAYEDDCNMCARAALPSVVGLRLGAELSPNSANK